MSPSELDMLAFHGAVIQRGMDFTPPHVAYIEHHRSQVFERRFRLLK